MVAGFGGRGTMHGPAVAELLAKKMAGRSDLTVDLLPLDPHREPRASTEWMVASKKV